jgi:hypothetical protein
LLGIAAALPVAEVIIEADTPAGNEHRFAAEKL